jgi:DegV family protein with EDD domain
MKIGFLTDSTCDLPAPILKKYNIHVLPIRITCEHRIVMDNKKPQPYQRINGLLKRGLKISSEPCEVDEIKNYFINLLSTYDYDYFICVMPMESRSESYLRTLDASIAARSEIRKNRLEKKWKPTVEIEVIDSSQISTGLGLVLLNTIKTFEKCQDFKHTVETAHKLTKYTQTYVLPSNLEYLYKQGAGKGDESVGFGSYLLGTALDMKPIVFVNNNYSEAIAKVKGYKNGINQILEMLMTHIHYNTIMGSTINISFGNTLKELKSLEKYQEFENLAKSHDVTILLSNMSATLNVNVGLNALAVGFLSPKIIRNFN